MCVPQQELELAPLRAQLLHHRSACRVARMGGGRDDILLAHLRENALFEQFIHTCERSFCQDRLGTNIGKVEKKDGVFRTAATTS